MSVDTPETGRRLFVTQIHNGRCWRPLLWAFSPEFAMHVVCEAMRGGQRARWYEVAARHRVRMTGEERAWLVKRAEERRRWSLARGLAP